MSSEDSSRDNSPALPPSTAPQQHQNQGGAPNTDTNDAVVPNNDDEGLDTSFFPAPAHYYKRYTDDNLAIKDNDALVTLSDGTTFTRRELDPPDIDDVVKTGSYNVFGDTWPVDEQLPSLGDMGVTEMFDKSQDRTQSLLTLLRAMLVTYTQLVSALLEPPPSLSAIEQAQQQGQVEPGQEPPTDPERLVEHIRLISINMHHLVNELRPIQARETLKNMMRQQIERRKTKTAAIKQRCAELADSLAQLKLDLTNVSSTLQENTLAEMDIVMNKSSNSQELVRRKLIDLADEAAQATD
ncbi:hypothetical protein OIO90_003835 [Microbotryomycetes sp. JL221]|nr:hypothetical protein OIO90_003835 [Microbotryomycetes sp. JL221]